METMFTAFIIDGTQIIGSTTVSGESRVKLLDNNYSLFQFCGIVYSYIKTEAFDDTLFIFIASFPYPILTV